MNSNLRFTFCFLKSGASQKNQRESENTDVKMSLFTPFSKQKSLLYRDTPRVLQEEKIIYSNGLIIGFLPCSLLSSKNLCQLIY